jgi:uncharacterized protein
MFVGVLRLTLYLPQPGSLKSKRHLVRSAVDRVKAKYNVSIAEVAENDLWQKSVLGVASVGNDHAFVNETLDKVADFVASMHGGQIHVIDRSLSIESYGDGFGDHGRTLADAEEEERRLAEDQLEDAPSIPAPGAGAALRGTPGGQGRRGPAPEKDDEDGDA